MTKPHRANQADHDHRDPRGDAAHAEPRFAHAHVDPRLSGPARSVPRNDAVVNWFRKAPHPKGS